MSANRMSPAHSGTYGWLLDFWNLGLVFTEMTELGPEGSKAVLKALGKEWGASMQRRHPEPALSLVQEEE